MTILGSAGLYRYLKVTLPFFYGHEKLSVSNNIEVVAAWNFGEAVQTVVEPERERSCEFGSEWKLTLARGLR